MHPVYASDAPTPIVIRDTARAILARPEYQLKPLDNDSFALLRFLWNAVKWLFSPFARLFETLDAISPLLAFGYVIVLCLVAVALLWHIIHTFRVALRGRLEDRRYSGVAESTLQPSELERLAQQAADRQDYISAVRYLFQACLLRLEHAEKRTLRKGATNHEYLRRFETTPAYEPLQRFVEIIDRKWFGQGRCEPSDFEECQRAHAEILMHGNA